MAFPVHIQMVKRAEGKLGRKLPLGYVAKRCEHNGGGGRGIRSLVSASDFRRQRQEAAQTNLQ